GRAQRLAGVRAVLSLDEEEVRFAGQEVAAVAAVSSDIASDAVRLIDVQYEQLPFVVELEPAMETSAPSVFGRTSNLEKPKINQRGDTARAFKDATAVHEAVYLTPVQTHVSLEVHGAVASWDGDRLTVWTSTQGIFTVRDDM